MSLLDELGRKHGTDKASTRHDFLRKYERYLAPFHDQPVKLLEIGIHDGASLRMWRDYFPKGSIIGSDIKRSKQELAEGRIAVEIGDCGSDDFLRSIVETYAPFDIIVDDGSHLWKHQQTAFLRLFDALAPGGVFIIEDIHTSYHPRYGAPDVTPTVEWLKGAVDMLVAGSEYSRLPKQPDHVERHWREEIDELIFIRESCIVTKAPATMLSPTNEPQ